MKDFQVKRLVFSSSSTVFGDPVYLPIDEAHPTGNCRNQSYKMRRNTFSNLLFQIKLPLDQSLLSKCFSLICTVKMHKLNHEINCISKFRFLAPYTVPENQTHELLLLRQIKWHNDNYQATSNYLLKWSKCYRISNTLRILRETMLLTLWTPT
jgi:hypothetical protein